MDRRRGTALAMARGFVPWALFWSLGGGARPVAGCLTALGASAALCAWQARRSAPRPVEVTALAFFVADATALLVLGPSALGPWQPFLASAALAGMAWATLLAGVPFTLQYARDDWPPEYSNAPLFRRINILLTVAWGTVFSLNAGLGLLGPAGPGARRWLTAALSPAALAAGIALSIVVPRWYPRRWAARELARRTPFTWPAPAFRRGTPGRSERHHDVIVVGAGVGGLTAAALLARRGLRVAVFEQHFLAGGFCTSWPRIVRRGDQRLRFVFDAGVHDVSGLGPHGAVRQLIRALDLDGRLTWRRVGQQYVLPELRVKVPDRIEDFAEVLAQRFPAERERIARFFADMQAAYHELYSDVDRTGGVPRPPATVEETLAYPSAHPHVFRLMHTPFPRLLDESFRDAGLKRVLTTLTGYLTDRPEHLGALAMIPIFGYYIEGGYYPLGGSQRIADALVEVIERHGGTVSLRAPVKRILVEEGRAGGVELADGRTMLAEALVSNADARRTFLELVGTEHLPGEFVERVRDLRPSTSAFMVFLGVEGVPDIEPMTICRDDEPGLAIATTSKVDPALAPAGHSNVTLVRLMPSTHDGTWNRRSPDYARRKRRAGDELVERAEQLIPGLRGRIVYRQDASPATFERYAWTTGGSIYGPALGPWRPPAKSPIAGLVLAGAGVFPGAGLEAVVISGTLAADALCPVESGGASAALALTA